MKFASLLLAFAALLGVAYAGMNMTDMCDTDLGMHVKHITSMAPASTWDWGVRVVKYNKTSGATHVIYDMNGDKFFVPASNNKILTTTAALLKIPKETTYSTHYYFNPETQDLCVYPTGDMTFTKANLVNISTQIAKDLNAQGHTTLASLNIDSSYFANNERVNGKWELGDLTWYYGAPPSAAVVDENAFTLQVSAGATVGSKGVISGQPAFPTITNLVTTGVANSSVDVDAFYPFGSDVLQVVGSVPLGGKVALNLAAPDALKFYAAQMAEALAAKGVTVTTQNTQGVTCQQSLKDTWSISSNHDVLAMINRTLLVSDNLFAEELLRHVGHEVGPAASSALHTGLGSVAATITAFSNSSAFSQHDGSGLSRFNLVTPNTLTSIFTSWMSAAHIDQGMLYKALLPVGGQTGSLRNRFTDIPGKIHAKTGSLTGVATLSGYADNTNYPNDTVIAFSVMVNGAVSNLSVIQAKMDHLVEHLVYMKPCHEHHHMAEGNIAFIWSMFGLSLVVFGGLLGCGLYLCFRSYKEEYQRV